MDINQKLYERIFELVSEINTAFQHKYHIMFDYTPMLDCAFIASMKKEHDPVNGWTPEREFVIEFSAPNRDGLINECIEYLEGIK